MYGYSPSWALSWDNRKGLIRSQLIESKADIICLQEVDMENFNEYFMPELAREEYKGAFYPKSRAKTMNETEKKSVDGCATFFKSAKLVHRRFPTFAESMRSRQGSNRPITGSLCSKSKLLISALPL